MSNNSIKLSINAKDNASHVLGGVKASTVALGVAAGNLATKGLTFLINKTRGFIDAALKCEAANTRIDASLRGIGAYTPELAQQFKDLAGTIQDEIGGSDEYFKDLISQLLSLGVGTEKIDQATRAVTALSAIGKKGTRAITAVARAVAGDYTAFNELIPAVQQATTEQEKLDAINKTIAAGYAQQQANLGTVGGAWDALKGRLGDAQEAFTNAIFKGLGLSDTFGDMQVAVGNFLKSARWNNFLSSLEKGAEFAKSLAGALTSTGGFKAVGVSIGNVILAALQDGADYLGDKISKALGQDSLKNYQNKWSNDPIARAARYFGSRSGGASKSEALAMMDNTGLLKESGKKTSRLKKAIEELKKTVQEHSRKTEENSAKVDDNTAQQKKAPALSVNVQNQQNQNQQKLNQVNKQIANQQVVNKKAGINQQIAQLQQNANAAAQKVAKAQAIINDKKTPAQALKEHNQKIAAEKASAKENKELMRRYDDAKERIKSAGNMGRKINPRDRALVDSVDAEKERQANAKKMLEEAKVDQDNAEQRKSMLEDELKGLQKDQLKELRDIKKKLVSALTVGS